MPGVSIATRGGEAPGGASRSTVWRNVEKKPLILRVEYSRNSSCSVRPTTRRFSSAYPAPAGAERAIGEYVEATVWATPDVACIQMQVMTAERSPTVTGTPIFGVPQDQARGHDALFDEPLLAVRVRYHGVQQHGPLRQATAELGELFGRKIKRQRTQLPGSIAPFGGAQDVERDLLFAGSAADQRPEPPHFERVFWLRVPRELALLVSRSSGDFQNSL